MPNGTLTIIANMAGQAAPLAGVAVTVYGENGAALAALTTGESGETPELTLPAPDKRYSLDAENTTVRPYAVYDVAVSKAGWRPQRLAGVQVFDGQRTLARLEMLPAAEGDTALARIGAGEDTITIPPHSLFAGNHTAGGSGPAPQAACAAGRVLSEVVVPKKITVHLGAPNASASNVSVNFQEYIANVASCEVYPTWVGATHFAERCHVDAAS